MKAFAVALAVGAVLSLLVAMVPHNPVEETPDEVAVNAKVDARLKQVLTGLLRAQTEQASLSR